jgi:hypothetical protein
LDSGQQVVEPYVVRELLVEEDPHTSFVVVLDDQNYGTCKLRFFRLKRGGNEYLSCRRGYAV